MEKKKLLFGTNNRNKLEEIRQMIGDVYEVLCLADLGKEIDVEETEPTLEGNALLKAKAFFKHSGLPCFADDTGLEVEALDGRPGVYSARYAGEGCSYEDNVRKMLAEMEGKSNRKARFRTVIAYFDGGEPVYFEGIVEGEITTQAFGQGGFGYDPIFRPDGYASTFAQLTSAEKNNISHRGKAVRAFARFMLDSQ